ncbi:hypothetical protein LINPERHAP1_LOCUS1507 [Linum perenne]
MEDAVAQYCALNNIAVFVNDDGIIITKGINDAAKGDAVSKKEARSKSVDMIPAYDLVIGDIDAYFKSLASVGTTSARNKPLNQQQLDEVIEVDDNLTKDKSQGDEDAVGADIVTDVEDVAGGNKVDATEDVVGVDKATSAAVSDGDSAPGSVLVENPVTDGGIVHAIVEKPVPDDGGKEKDAGAEKIIQDVPIDQEEDDDDDDQDKDDTNSNAKGSGEDSGDDDDDNSGAGGGLRVNDSVKGSTTNDDSSEADRGVNEPPPTKDSTHTQDGKEPESNDAVGANAFSSSAHFKDLVVPETVSPIKKDSRSSSGPKQAAIPIPVFVSDSDPKIDAPKPKITVPIKAVTIKIFKSANSDAPITEWFMPAKHDGNYVVFVIDNVNKKYHFLDSMQVVKFTDVYEVLCEKLLKCIDAYITKNEELTNAELIKQGLPVMVKKKVKKNAVDYKWNVVKKIKQSESKNSGVYAINWCESWWGKYIGKMSSLWKKNEYQMKRRMDVLCDLILSEENLMLSELRFKATNN